MRKPIEQDLPPTAHEIYAACLRVATSLGRPRRFASLFQDNMKHNFMAKSAYLAMIELSKGLFTQTDNDRPVPKPKGK